MTVRHQINAFIKCTGFLLVFSDIMCATLAMVAIDHGDTEYSPEVQKKIETFKQDILYKLGKKRPLNLSNVTQNIEEKRRMIQEYRRYMEESQRLYKHQLEEDEDEDNDEGSVQSKTLYSMEYKGERPPQIAIKDWNVPRAVRLYFPTHLSHPKDDHTRELHVHSAVLKLFIKEARPNNLKDHLTVDKQIRLNAYQILSIKNSTNYKRTLLDSKLVPLTKGGQVNFEIAKGFQEWINAKESNLGIEIAAESQDLNEVVTFDLSFRINGVNETSVVTSRKRYKTSPSIHLYVQEKDILKRVKRHAKNVCTRSSGETRCCRYPIKISFREIQWDKWIIAPQEYRGYYCAGECPGKYKMANTFAGIKAMLHMIQPKKVPSPCCAATKLSPFMILHYDTNGKYTFSKFSNLVVEQCRCG